jgi:hypothetical protein
VTDSDVIPAVVEAIRHMHGAAMAVALSGLAGCGGLIGADGGEAGTDSRDATVPDVGSNDDPPDLTDAVPPDQGPDHSCPGSDPSGDSGASLVTLATGQHQIDGMAIDSTSIYWTARVPGNAYQYRAILATPLSGGTPTTLLGVGDAGFPGSFPSAIVVDATNVYWLDTGFVAKIPKGGGSLTPSLAPADMPSALATDGVRVYWADLASNGSLASVPVGGGTPTTFATDQPYPGSIAVGGANVYWTNGSTVMSAPKTGGVPMTLASGQSPSAIAVDSVNAYWVNDTTGGNVVKAPVSGGAATTLARAQGSPRSIAVDATSVYWTDNLSGTVMTVRICGGAPVTLASGQDGPTFIAVDATSVYWTNRGGTVMKRSPK